MNISLDNWYYLPQNRKKNLAKNQQDFNIDFDWQPIVF